MIENFAPNLINLRKRAGLSQKDLAQELEISPQTISNIENQIAYPTFTNLEKIAHFFNATPNQLFGTPTQIELENSVLRTDEYSEKAKLILSTIKRMEEFADSNDYDNILWLSRGRQKFSDIGDALYEDYDGEITLNPEKPIGYAYYPSPIDNLFNSVRELQEDGTYSELLNMTRGPQIFGPGGIELYEDYDGSITNSPDFARGYAYGKSAIEQVLMNKETIRGLVKDIDYIKKNLDILNKDSE